MRHYISQQVISIGNLLNKPVTVEESTRQKGAYFLHSTSGWSMQFEHCSVFVGDVAKF
jgi:hypothetical protein